MGKISVAIAGLLATNQHSVITFRQVFDNASTDDIEEFKSCDGYDMVKEKADEINFPIPEKDIDFVQKKPAAKRSNKKVQK